MKMYTSYFANRELNTERYELVSIARSMPNGFHSTALIYEAMPSYQLLRDYKENKITWAQYEKRYQEEVQMQMPIIVHKINSIASRSSKPIVFLCWEGKGKNCHRHIFAKMITEMTGYEVIEL